MKKKGIDYGYRNMRHAQEKRMYHAHKDLIHIRGRRHAAMLGDPWDDCYFCDQKTWKVNRKTQYRDRRNLNQYTVEFEPYDYEWYLFEYFHKHNIPYRKEGDKFYGTPERVSYWAKKEIPKEYLEKILCRRIYE